MQSSWFYYLEGGFCIRVGAYFPSITHRKRSVSREHQLSNKSANLKHHKHANCGWKDASKLVKHLT